MHIVKKFIVLFIIVIASYILYNLFKQRSENRIASAAEIKSATETAAKAAVREGLFGINSIVPAATPEEEVKSLPIGGVNIQAIPETQLDLPLREFIVKSSYNSGISGKFASIHALRYVLGRGCRLLDFEIYTREGSEYVSFANDDEFSSLGTNNREPYRLKLTNALNMIGGSAFSSDSPSPGDPIFIQLRVKNNNKETYTRIAKAIDFAFNNRLATESINSSTPIRRIMGKVVIIMDKSSSPDYKNYTSCDTGETGCLSLDKYIDLESGTTELSKFLYTDFDKISKNKVMPASSGNASDITTFTMITPSQFDEISSPKPEETLKNYYSQFLLYKFYEPDENLTAYEDLFNTNKSSFMPMSAFIAISNRKNAAPTDDDNQ
jgi:hypothetical protein